MSRQNVTSNRPVFEGVVLGEDVVRGVLLVELADERGELRLVLTLSQSSCKRQKTDGEQKPRAHEQQRIQPNKQTNKQRSAPPLSNRAQNPTSRANKSDPQSASKCE